MKIKYLLAVLLLVTLVTSAAFARNPIVKYFAHLLDETKSEIAIGTLIRDSFIKELEGTVKVRDDIALSDRMQKFVENSQRPEIRCKVIILESDVPDAIPLPNGTVFITSGLMKMAKNTEQENFILASNLMHVILRHPMKLIKKEGLYAKFLNLLKISAKKRKPAIIRTLIRDYLRNLPTINQIKADFQGILLTPAPENTRKEAIKLLESFSVSIWPIMPWDRGDLPSRIKNLKESKFPR